MHLMLQPQLSLYSVNRPLIHCRPSARTRPSNRLPSSAAGVSGAQRPLTVARNVLALLLRGSGLRSDAMSGVLDDARLTSGQTSSIAHHVIRYRGQTEGAGEVASGLAAAASSLRALNSVAVESTPTTISTYTT